MSIPHLDEPPQLLKSTSAPSTAFLNSFRGALVHWEPLKPDHETPQTAQSQTTSKPRRKPFPTHLWKLSWVVADSVLWILAAMATMVVLHLLAKESVFNVLGVFLFPLIASLVASWVSGGYDRDSDFASLRFTSEFLISGLIASFVGPAIVALFSTYGQGTQTSRFFLFVTPFFATAAWLAARRLWWTNFAESHSNQRILVIGTLDEARRLEHAITLTERMQRVVQIDPAAASSGGLETLLRSPSSFLENELALDASILRQDTVVLAPSAQQSIQKLGPFLVSLHSSTVPVFTWHAFWSKRIKTLDWGIETPEWFFERNYRLSQNSAYPHLKRIGDIIVSLIGLTLSFPIMLLTALAIRLDSKGPVIFKQRRVGLRAKEFTIYKFRTMTLGSEKSGTTTTKNDARITKLGHILRKYRLDEFPQLLNVLKGDMSMVGPRPEWTTCVENYENVLAHYHLRHLVKPGITGWAQVNYPYGEGVEDARNKLSFDLYYVAQSSFMLDCSILLKTIYVLAGRVGGQ